MDFLEIGFSTSVSITNGLRPKAVLNNLTTLVQGTHSAFRKELRLEENQAYFNTMEGKRAEIFSKILENMKQPDRDYSYAMALMDIVRYAKAGTLDDALNEIQAMAGKKKQDAEDDLEIKKASLIGRLPTLDEAKTSLSAADVINKLAAMLAVETSKAGAVKTLQDIVQAIGKDEELVTAINNEPSLKDKFGELKTLAAGTDGQALFNKLVDFKRTASPITSFTKSNVKINAIIVDKGKEVK
jgi:hypothetical protein